MENFLHTILAHPLRLRSRLRSRSWSCNFCRHFEVFEKIMENSETGFAVKWRCGSRSAKKSGRSDNHFQSDKRFCAKMRAAVGFSWCVIFYYFCTGKNATWSSNIASNIKPTLPLCVLQSLRIDLHNSLRVRAGFWRQKSSIYPADRSSKCFLQAIDKDRADTLQQTPPS